MSKIKVRIPATTANMGSGFDTLGMALNLYNEIEVEEINGETEIYNKGIRAPGDFRDNLIYKSIKTTMERQDYFCDGVKIDVTKCDIPMSRGLGSSSSCIVGGIAAANSIIGSNMSIDDLISLATEIEGHPDNVAPAALGGMVISLKEDNKITYSRVNLPLQLKFVAMIPSFEVNTALSRKVLPKSYSKEDCIFNVSRAAMLVNALNNSELDTLRVCFQDRIHQPYRKNLIKNCELIFEECKELGSVGEFISGSGPTLMAVIADENKGEFMNSIKKFLSGLEDEWNVILLEPDLNGVKLLK
ncbi:MAG: homoserine kinase [Clostridium sp.]|jgi:homoserine kinase|uniref:homoserine kinase n=1 Tax=Clostridium sp. TaxID=1506 RepID=UPI0025C04F91|nr:homoserine kinase [Clostridium sp.]MCH3964741.1 homoserine kinase [Clostridium sp.]MCI1715212.1 homoserine kinase [Clostridium sp.]MCI1799474.1 homoserine kinase [Clostridium sp.]MCI1813395.1 homoserine kinase [Clostridium sp.]MCI1870286.1 homoserine kinase [Clostridium sp.]